MEFSNHTEIHTSYFGPWRNCHGYKMEFAIIDDLYMLKTVRPDDTVVVSYHWTEEDLEEKINVYNQNRYY